MKMGAISTRCLNIDNYYFIDSFANHNSIEFQYCKKYIGHNLVGWYK